jgi:hypothetical protein
MIMKKMAFVAGDEEERRVSLRSSPCVTGREGAQRVSLRKKIGATTVCDAVS